MYDKTIVMKNIFWLSINCKNYNCFISRVCILSLFGVVFCLFLLISNISKAEITYTDISGKLSLDSRYFFKDPDNEIQQKNNLSMALEPEVYLENLSGNSFTFSPFFRLDQTDPRRTHWDLREAYALFYGEFESSQWEIRIGFDKVFWGVTESIHLVDIINQNDGVEDPNLEEKLGQPMFHGTWASNFGNIEIFLLPYFRDKTFLGQRSRLRENLVVDQDQTTYESAAGRQHIDFAMRYSNTFEFFDIGLSIFDGTSRSPNLILGFDRNGSVVLVPFYEQIRQYSFDTQATIESWLLKFEGYWRDGEKNRESIEQDYAALVGGFEYTIYELFKTRIELGLIIEMLWDSRGKQSLSPFENDLFTGIRLAINDIKNTELFLGVMQDLDESSRSFALEIGRRINDQWSLDLSTTFFSNITPRDLQFPIRRDNYVELKLNYSF
ncbi:MAG: hypothetical protein CL567_05015 [Alphaproteobacteria bacterium]|nr:hypothetical protein [Alphaproteobacteria bacterium]|tara:strand:+ start:1361 stop:2677 length:1317 start_codon:yes stop_codon:yes gene_type:complete